MKRPNPIFAQFLRFGFVGIVGFAVDATALYLLIFWGGFGLYSARLLSYLAAATTTWALNRRFTFPGSSAKRASIQWARFVAVNAAGGVVNYGVYSVLVASSPPFAEHPVFAVAAGSLSGLAFNFTASRRLVFRT